MDPNGDGNDLPATLVDLARKLRGRSWEASKRLVVSRVGGVRPGERFADDVADAVFLRIQRTAQVGQYASEEALRTLGRNARRLEGEGTIRLYRCAPRGAGIRPGDFATDLPAEARYYAHGGHVLHALDVPRAEVFRVDGALGDGTEFVYLPRGHVAPEPKEFFPSFEAFWRAANPSHEPDASPDGEPSTAWPSPR